MPGTLRKFLGLLTVTAITVGCTQQGLSTPTSATSPSPTTSSVVLTGQTTFQVGIAGHIVLDVSETPSKISLDLGDGAAVQLAPNGTVSNFHAEITHAYARPGAFTVQASVTTADGRLLSATLVLSVVLEGSR
jgi:hypothetical protein